MTAKTIEVQYTVNLGNYQTVRIGGTFELEPDEKASKQIIEVWNGLKLLGEKIKQSQ